MNKQFEAIQSELEKRVSEVLFYVWDPIGINRMPACRDEYEDYVPIITAYILNKFPESGVDALMMFIMEQHIGVRLTRAPRRKSQHLEALRMLTEWRGEITSIFQLANSTATPFPKDESFPEQLNWSRDLAQIRKVHQSSSATGDTNRFEES